MSLYDTFDPVAEATKIVHGAYAQLDGDYFTTFFADGITLEGYRGGVYELRDGIRFEVRRGRRLICHIHATGQLAHLVRAVNPGHAFAFYVRAKEDAHAEAEFNFVLTGLEPLPQRA
jgi:hypothetical protein